MSARLPAGLEVSTLVRQVAAAGGFATILSKGEADSGAILVAIRDRDGAVRAYERMPQPDGARRWHLARSAESQETASLDEYLSRRRLQDPDLWIVELDVPQGEQFIGLSPPRC